METVNYGMVNHKPIRAIIGTYEQEGPRKWIRLARNGTPQATRWFDLEGLGWPGIKTAAGMAGLSFPYEASKSFVSAWEFLEDEPKTVWEVTATEIPAEVATELISRIGRPTKRVANNEAPYKRKNVPPGREGAARKLARTGLPSWLTQEQAKDIYDMFAGMDRGDERERHIHFWAWAVKNKSEGV